VEFFAKMTAVQEFMAEQSLSKSLMARTESYLAMLWRVHRYKILQILDYKTDKSVIFRPILLRNCRDVKSWLFTLHMGKPVGSRFGQMVNEIQDL